MAGIYIHIPFCKSKCSYCDFYSETKKEFIAPLVEALATEIDLRKAYLNSETIETIYFGGGTPSLLQADDFKRIFTSIQSHFQLTDNAEITLEANPDDLTEAYLASLSNLPFNRISMGVQSFNNYYLGILNRRHTARQSRQAIQNVRNHGIGNISIDLMYGLPYQTIDDWTADLDTALQMGVQHISAYGLSYEENTLLWKLLKDERIEPANDEDMSQMYRLLRKKMTENGFEAYEISNFARPGYRSRHNSSYWKQVPYLGIGPSAHSYDGRSRQWNVSSISRYIHAIKCGHIPAEKEILSMDDQYNDFIMVSLRTAEGIDLKKLEENFGSERKEYCLENIKTFIDTEKASLTNNEIRLNTEGILISNIIMSELMKV